MTARTCSRKVSFFVLLGALWGTTASATKLQLGLRAGGTVSGDTTSALSLSNLGYTLGVGLRTIGNGFLQIGADAMLASRRYEVGEDTVTTRSVYVPAQLVLNLNTIFVSGGGYYATSINETPGSTDYGWVGGVGTRTERFSLELRYSRGLKNSAGAGETAIYPQYVDLLVGLWLF